MPKVSIVIPAYNAEAYIRLALKSVFTQTYQDFECIVVDDGSTDKTADIVESMADSRVRLLKIPNSGGPARPRNVGIDNASGDFIFLFDADDVMRPDKLELSVNAFNQHPTGDVLFTNYNSIDEDGNILNNNYLEDYDSLWSLLVDSKKEETLIDKNVLYPSLVKINFVGASSVALRRCALTSSDRFNECLRNSDDRLFLIQFSRHHNGIFINKILHSYRVRTTGISNRDFSFRGISKIEALKIVKKECIEKSLLGSINSQIARDYAAIAYDYKTKSMISEQRKNAIESLKFDLNFMAIKLLVHSVLIMLRNRLFFGKH